MIEASTHRHGTSLLVLEVLLTSQVAHSTQVHFFNGMKALDDVRRSLSHCIHRGHGDCAAALEVRLALEEKHEDAR